MTNPSCQCVTPAPEGCSACRDAFTDPTLLAYRARIAELRRQRCHVTAGIMRDELLCQLENWLDPAGMAYREQCQAEQGAAAGRLAGAIDLTIGF